MAMKSGFYRMGRIHQVSTNAQSMDDSEADRRFPFAKSEAIETSFYTSIFILLPSKPIIGKPHNQM